MLEGYEIIAQIENVPKGRADKPVETVKIVKSGELESEEKTEEKGSSHEEL